MKYTKNKLCIKLVFLYTTSWLFNLASTSGALLPKNELTSYWVDLV